MTDHDRDRAIERLLQSHRTDDAAPLSQDCLDAEVLAAWMEGELPEVARVSAERHAAGCSRCQALLATMARTEPDSEIRPWWSTLTAKWLIPIGAMATALMVWVSVERTRPNPVTPPAPQASAAREDRATRPATAVVPPVNPPEVNKRAQAGQQMAAVPDLRTKPQVVGGVSAGSRDAALEPKPVSPPPPGTNVVGGTPGRMLDAVQPQERAAADTSAKSVAPPSAAPAPPPPAMPLPASRPLQAVPPLEQKAGAPKAMAEAVSAAVEPAAAPLAGGGGGGRGFAVPVEIRSPEAGYRWRITPPSGIQRTTDDGATWAVVDPIVAATAESRSALTLVAGSSPAREVCWIVGRAGVVLLSVDGATWQRRPLQEAVDLTAVRATDASNAVVTAADGRRFATVNGGVTWTPMK